MRLPKLAIQNYQFVLILVALALFVGLSSYLNMPRSEDPNPEFPNYTIVAVYPGVGPEDIEELVVDPLEEALEEVEDLDKVNTKIEEGVAVISIEGEFGVDTDALYDEILREVNTVRGDLPEDLFSLDVTQFKPRERVNIQQFALVSESASYSRMTDIAEDFEYQLEKIDGVQGAEIEAYPEEEVRISLDFQRMASQNVSLRQVVGILQSENLNIPGGDVQSLNKSFNIKSSGGYKTLDEIADVVVGANGEKLVKLSDVAEIHMD